MEDKPGTEYSEQEVLTRVYDRYFGLQAEAEKKEFEDMKNRKSERLGPQCIVLHYSLPAETLEEERTTMKNFASEIGELLTPYDSSREQQAMIRAVIFFGNYARQNHPANRGRGWSDAELALWLNWIRAGLPGGEWHLYYGKILKP